MQFLPQVCKFFVWFVLFSNNMFTDILSYLPFLFHSKKQRRIWGRFNAIMASVGGDGEDASASEAEPVSVISFEFAPVVLASP